MINNTGILVFGELSGGKLASITLELLTIGRKLGDDLKQDLNVLLIGSDSESVGQDAINYGADRVYWIEHPLLENYQTETYKEALLGLYKQIMPDIVLMGQTSIGKDLAPSLAFELDTVAVLDCIALSIDPNARRMEQIKPVYGGNAIATYVAESGRPQIATLRPKTVYPSQKDGDRKGEVIKFQIELDPSKIRVHVLGMVKDEIVGEKLEEANVIICGGRGMGSAEAFAQLNELSKILHGVVGGTRPACDAGWLPPYLQIGLTGKLVSPNIYLGVALSGSSQHQAGMAGSKNIIAINKDPEANIFNIAHYGVVGDYRKILPSFMEKCKELVSK